MGAGMAKESNWIHKDNIEERGVRGWVLANREKEKGRKEKC
jgi:hypothetical protein